MAFIYHPATGFPIGDPELLPLSESGLPSPAELQAALSPLILSASGWRKVFAAPRPADPRASWAGLAPASSPDEDSLGEGLAPADLVIAGTAAFVFGNYLKASSGRPDPALLLGMDTRPTGPALADLMCRVWLGMGLRPRQLFIVPAPEIMAYARSARALPPEHEESASGFCYISASHNPPAHNGFKFGLGGGVLSGAEIAPLIEEFRHFIAEPAFPARLLALLREAEPRELARVYAAATQWKRRSVSAYTLFARELVTGRADPEGQEELLSAMADAAAERPVGVLAEQNGSARCLSIDADFLAGLGVEYRALNDRPRAFARRIVPEGLSLEPARAALAEARADDPAFVAGYAPDCDGDRGNLVYWDEAAEEARLLGAQEVFALAVLSELALLVREGRLRRDGEGRVLDKVAVAVNDATSLRIEAIARVFGAEVFRAETGEANAVGLAASLRARGYVVRILGEGSNGGNITYPAEVRDPLATLGALLKLLLLRDAKGEALGDAAGEGLFHIWMRLSGRLEAYRPGFGLSDILASLPAFQTTSVFESRAALRIETKDQVALKRRFLPIFLGEWAERRAELERRLGLVSWRALASRGMAETELGEDFAASFRGEASGKGGLRLVFKNAAGADTAFLWMRGSGTEPVFRIMADLAGGAPEDEEYLLSWLESMVRRADRA